MTSGMLARSRSWTSRSCRRLPCLTSSRAEWSESDDGLTPLDSATQVAIPEFDGRIITVPFSFKEIAEDGLISYVADAERAARVAGIAVKHAALRHIPAADKRIALMLSAYPTKHARIGNAVGLDTPASTVRSIRAPRRRRLRRRVIPGRRRAGRRCPVPRTDRRGRSGRGEWLTHEQLAGNPVRIPASVYQGWFDALGSRTLQRIGDPSTGAPPPGTLFVDIR